MRVKLSDSKIKKKKIKKEEFFYKTAHLAACLQLPAKTSILLDLVHVWKYLGGKKKAIEFRSLKACA